MSLIPVNEYNLNYLENAYTAFRRDFPSFDATSKVDKLRSSEYPRLDKLNQVYLDYTGGGLYSLTQLRQHMKLLDQWRNDVVRDADRLYTSTSGVNFEKSLQNTCMECHSNKAKFCDSCHTYMGVTPFCWDCHIEPEETE